MRVSQEEIEALFSQRNIHDVLHQAIAYKMGNGLVTWSIRAYFQVMAYLEGDYYDSKALRIAELNDYIERYDLDRILVAMLASVIRGRKDQSIQQCIGYLQSYIPHDCHFDRARTAGELIAVCGGPGKLFEITRPVADEAPNVTVNQWPIIHEMFAEQFEWIEDTFFNPPLIKPPKRVSNRHSCGYHTFDEPVILGKLTQHDHNLDYEALNILNKIPWILDPEILALHEQPPGDMTDRQEIQNFIQHAHEAKRVYKLLGDQPFHIAWQFDSRGRLYSHGHHVNFQSYEYKKVMLNFNHSEILT